MLGFKDQAFRSVGLRQLRFVFFMVLMLNYPLESESKGGILQVEKVKCQINNVSGITEHRDGCKTTYFMHSEIY